MAELGITGKRVRKKPKYLRDDEEEEEEKAPPVKKEKKVKKEKEKKSKSKKSSKKSKEPVEESPKPQGIKLKIKFGGAKSSTSSHTSTPTFRDVDDSVQGSYDGDSDELDVEVDIGDGPPSTLMDSDDDDVDYDRLYAAGQDLISDPKLSTPKSASGQQLKKTPGGNVDKDDTSDEEREWLEAVESGDIDQYEKKKAEKNPANLTARQKRMIHSTEESEQLYELPSLLKGQKTLTEEQIAIKNQRALKRKQIALEKSEKAKKLTVDRLLKKSNAAAARGKGAKSAGNLRPHMRYLISKENTTLSLPEGVDHILPPQKSSEPPKPVRCGIRGCKNIKKYNCSKTNIPLCSLVCYKKNIAQHAKT